jgi:hypothetical protein
VSVIIDLTEKKLKNGWYVAHLAASREQGSRRWKLVHSCGRTVTRDTHQVCGYIRDGFVLACKCQKPVQVALPFQKKKRGKLCLRCGSIPDRVRDGGKCKRCDLEYAPEVHVPVSVALHSSMGSALDCWAAGI